MVMNLEGDQTVTGTLDSRVAAATWMVCPGPVETRPNASPRSNPAFSYRPSHARSPTVKRYCPSHGAHWLEELPRPLKKGGAPVSLRANGTSFKCVLVARVPQSYQLLPAVYTMLASAYFDDSLAACAAGNIFHATT
jgi:hypothetical protein